MSQASAGPETDSMPPGAKTLMTASGIEVVKRQVPKAKLQVGSSGQPVGYNPKETVFHVSSIPPAKREDKKNAKKEAMGDRVGLKQPKWNISIETPEKLCQRRTRQIPDHDRPGMHQYNFRAEVLPPKNPHFEKAPKKSAGVMGVVTGGDPSSTFSYSGYGEQVNLPPEASMAGADERLLCSQVSRRTAEMMVNPKLVGKTWNHSTYVEKFHVQHRVQMDEEARVRNSKKKNAAVRNYKSPEERAKEERERLRLVKAGKAMSGDEAVNENEDYSAIPRPRNRFAVEANRKYKKTAHSGVWEFNKMMGKYVWSDTMSEIKDSPGDITFVKNPDGWNYAAPN